MEKLESLCCCCCLTPRFSLKQTQISALLREGQKLAPLITSPPPLPTSACYYLFCPDLYQPLTFSSNTPKAFVTEAVYQIVHPFFPHTTGLPPSLLCNRMLLHSRWWSPSRRAMWHLQAWPVRATVSDHHTPSHPTGWMHENPTHLDTRAEHSG